MPFVTANGIKLFYQQLGHGEDVVMIAGLGADHTSWVATAHKLSAKYRITIFDNRGAGQSDSPPGPYTTQQMAKDTLALMTELGIEKAHIVGHSLGAYIAQYLAINAPQRVKKLVLIGGKAYQDALGKLRRENAIALMQAGVDKKLRLENSMLWVFGEKFLSDTRCVNNYIQISQNNPYPQSEAGYLGQAAATLTHDTRAHLANITAETLVITGQEDINTPLYHAELLLEQIPLACMQIIADCGHIPQLEQPRALLQLLQDFLKKDA